MTDRSTVPFALVVDDDAVVLTDACEILEEAGFRTLSAYDADEALAILEGYTDAVVLLFTDVEMPGSMNGLELAREVATAWPETAIIVASGRVAPKEDQLPEHATFVAKPFSAGVVTDRLRQILPDGRKPAPLKQAR